MAPRSAIRAGKSALSLEERGAPVADIPAAHRREVRDGAGRLIARNTHSVKRRQPLSVRLSALEEVKIRELAVAREVSLHAWMRAAILSAAELETALGVQSGLDETSGLADLTEAELGRRRPR
jgi:hypothetical protein